MVSHAGFLSFFIDFFLTGLAVSSAAGNAAALVLTTEMFCHTLLKLPQVV